MAYCFDCEVEVPEGQPLCDACEEHRADGHRPTASTYCHGAGPWGFQVERLQQQPRPITEDERTPWPEDGLE